MDTTGTKGVFISTMDFAISRLFSADEIVVSVYNNQVFSFGLGDTTRYGRNIRRIFENRVVLTGLSDVGEIRERSKTARNRGRLEGINVFYVTDALIIVINFR